MYTRGLIPSVLLALLLPLCAWADSQPSAATRQPMSPQTRLLVIRSLNAEFVYPRRPLPMGTKSIVVKDGQIIGPPAAEMQELLSNYPPAAKPGERVQITGIEIKNDKILLQINGGPKRKKKWYQRVQVGVGAAQTNPTDEVGNPHGLLVELAFDKFVPEMTGDQVRELLSPVFDFKAKSAAEAYLDVAPPKIREAIKDHKVLVGMNHEMVMYAKGRPDKRMRENDAQGHPYEEWMYGEPPQEVQFVRFTGDEVVRLEIMKVDGQKIVRTEKEVDQKAIVAGNQQQAPPAAQPSHAPTLRRPGEPVEDESGGSPSRESAPPPSVWQEPGSGAPIPR